MQHRLVDARTWAKLPPAELGRLAIATGARQPPASSTLNQNGRLVVFAAQPGRCDPSVGEQRQRRTGHRSRTDRQRAPSVGVRRTGQPPAPQIRPAPAVAPATRRGQCDGEGRQRQAMAQCGRESVAANGRVIGAIVACLHWMSRFAFRHIYHLFVLK
jgi:hypothetical protein